MRAMQILAWLAALGLLLLPFLRKRAVDEAPGAGGPTDELVKDPVCQTYVVRSRAVTRAGPEGPRYFCSDTCAHRDA